MNFTGQLFTPTPPTSYIGRFSVSPEQLPYISEHTTFLFAELDAHNFPLALPCSGGKIAPACEVQFLRPDTTARDQAVRSDNTASRACRFEVSAEQPPKDDLFLAKLHNPLSYIHV